MFFHAPADPNYNSRPSTILPLPPHKSLLFKTPCSAHLFVRPSVCQLVSQILLLLFLYFLGLLPLLLPKCSSPLKHSRSPPSREKPCIQFWPTRCTGLVTLRYKWVGAMICDDLWMFALEDIVDDKRKMRDWPLGPTIKSIHAWYTIVLKETSS